MCFCDALFSTRRASDGKWWASTVLPPRPVGRPQCESPILPGRMKRREEKGGHGHGHVGGGECGRESWDENGGTGETDLGWAPTILDCRQAARYLNNLVRCVPQVPRPNLERGQNKSGRWREERSGKWANLLILPTLVSRSLSDRVRTVVVARLDGCRFAAVWEWNSGTSQRPAKPTPMSRELHPRPLSGQGALPGSLYSRAGCGWRRERAHRAGDYHPSTSAGHLLHHHR